MKILYLSQYFFPEQFLNNAVARALVEGGHDVTVVCCVPNYPSGRMFDGYSNRSRTREKWHGIDVWRVLTVPRGKSSIQLLLNYLVYPVAAAWRILWLGRERRGDVSFVSMPSPLLQALAGIFAKRLWGIPTVYWVQDIWPESAIITLGIRNRFLVRALEAICGWIYRQADLILVQSDGFHDAIARFGVNRSRIATLPNCAPALFETSGDPEIPEHIRTLIPADRRVLMFAGNIGDSQDFETIIAAARLLPSQSDLLIAVVGSGRAEARVRRMAADEGVADRFLFLGRHPENDMPAFFACADAMLVSLRDEPIFELTIPSKVQAYLAAARPILASLSGEAAATVRLSGAGIVAPPSSPQELRRAMIEISAKPASELRDMGQAGRIFYDRHFSLAAVSSTLAAHLGAVIKQHGRSAGKG